MIFTSASIKQHCSGQQANTNASKPHYHQQHTYLLYSMCECNAFCSADQLLLHIFLWYWVTLRLFCFVTVILFHACLMCEPFNHPDHINTNPVNACVEYTQHRHTHTQAGIANFHVYWYICILTADSVAPSDSSSPADLPWPLLLVSL